MKPFAESDKYNWELSPDSLVVEAGTYKGNFAIEIANRYHCRIWTFEPVWWKEATVHIDSGVEDTSKIVVFPAGLAEVNKGETIGVKGEATGRWASDAGESVLCSMLPVSLLYTWSRCSLLALNCEGGEFPILETIIRDGKLHMFDNILCQPHSCVPDAVNRWLKIRDEINKTHETLFDEAWVWSGFSIKK